MSAVTRRRFIAQGAGAASGALCWPVLAHAAASLAPRLHFPTAPRERIAIASYPFREIIAAPDKSNGSRSEKIDLKDFAAHVLAKFNIRKIEPWSAHFSSLEKPYLEQFRAAIEKVNGAIVNIAVDGDHSPYSADPAEREQAVDFSRKWIDAAAIVGSPSIRTNIAAAKDSKPDQQRTADSLRRVADYASKKNVVVNLENDNPESEDPLFLVKVVKQVNSPWLHTLPDFANTLASSNEEYAYGGIDAMFADAYNICHVKDGEARRDGHLVHVNMEKTFGLMKKHGYKGYCSMEWDSPGDAHAGTAKLIEATMKFLS